jgi:DNA-3-methyladenine glycosylase II
MVLELPIEQMRAVGLSNQKASYLKNVAQFFRDNDLENKDWSNLSDEEIITYLTQIKGVGRWTVQMILMFTLARLDVFPVLDLGIQQGMKRLYSLEQEGKDLHKTMHEIAEHWRPFRSVASRYIWKWKDLKLK